MPPRTGGTPISGWRVFEEESYNRAVAQLGTHEYFDDALAPVEYALHRNPLGFKKVPGFETLYLAKTKLRLFGLEIIPSYRLWFRIDVHDRAVAKLWVEIAPPEDMGIADDPFDPDEIAF